MRILDYAQRQQALDITQSFIVQAPAGSGKTELLTQRFLNLLATVAHPEEIIAVTFTKKAASEMRNRILNALECAAYQPQPIEDHALQTWTIAQKVLLHGQQQQWNILENPNRLRVQTIDSLCASLAKQMPIMARLGSQANIIEDADELYIQAAENLLATLEEKPPWLTDLTSLLLHLDNNHERVVELFVEMLKNRNQWLPHILKSHRQDNLREQLEENLQTVIYEAIESGQQQFPEHVIGELLALINFARENLQLAPWNALPSIEIDQINNWQYLANFLLTNAYTWRRTVDKRQGFPSEANSKEKKAVFKEYKQQMLNLLEEFSAQEELRLALQAILQCPPATYTDAQWLILENLLTLLPILAAQLQVIFQQTGQIDFVALTQAALEALGDDENPSELALRLDYKIQHLLIDEFQDTSATQYHLLERITAGWQPNDGRSLFLVGDPMQSIYSFRAAEVGLFLRAQQAGVGDVVLTPLTLQVNFRSNSAIVNWVNASFTTIFPATANIATGAVPISQAVAFHGVDDTGKIFGYQHNPELSQITEADTIVDIIQRTNPEASIAILVKAKSHLHEIIPALQQANIAYQAIEIEALDHLMIIQDLLSLTCALLHFADRLAWLSILRAPWCALSLTDLEFLSKNYNSTTIWDNLNNPAIVAQLSLTAQLQLKYFTLKMHSIFNERGRMSITDWLQAAWLQLGGAVNAKNSSELESAQAFFELLAKLETSERFSIENLYHSTNKLFAKPNSTANVQLMSIHKAKGLEFDIVILPGLEHGQQYDPNKLLLWLEKPRYDNSEELLLAPIKAKAHGNDAIYDYVRSQQKVKQEYEAGRLLYVATTRAKKQLYLLSTHDSQSNDDFRPRTNSFLAKLWPNSAEMFTTSKAKAAKPLIIEEQKVLTRIQQPLKSPLLLPEKIIVYHSGNRPIIEDYTARHIGTVIHELLNQMSQIEKSYWPELLAQKPFLLAKLRRLSITNVEKAYHYVEQIIKICSQSERATWILQQPQSHSEYALTATIDGKIQHIVIDRMFIEKDICWIIDYKTSQPKPSQSTEQFLQHQKETYLPQLTNYAKIIQLMDPRDINVGLYFPLCDQWVSWNYSQEEISNASHV